MHHFEKNWFLKEIVNSAFYVNGLEKLREEIKLEIRGKLAKELLRLYDNESPHTPAQTKEALKGLNMEILPHPPYPPDHAPSDYYLFGSMKKFSGDRFSTPQLRDTAIFQWQKITSENWFAVGMQQLPSRWQESISWGGYMEPILQWNS